MTDETTVFPEIRTQRLLLRRFTENDLEHVFAGLSNPDVIEYYGVNYTTLEGTKDQLKFFNDLETNGTGTWWAICSADNHTFYGGCGLNNLNKQHRKAEIGFWLLPQFWKQGILSEALPLVCDHAFKKLGLHRIEGFVESGNENSRKVLEKFDFHCEGTMRDCEIKNGRFISLEIYSKLK